jgi:predicted GNAT superfamily acetyltransferase
MLNVSRLCAVVEQYVPDYYGHFPSVLEKGLASDRFVVNWRIGTARVAKRLRGEAPPFDPLLPCVNETRLNAGSFP